ETDMAGPAVTLYCGYSILLSISWIILQHACLYPASLFKPEVDIKKIKNVFNYTKLGLALYTITLLLSFLFPITAFAIIILLYLVWLIMGISLNLERMTD